MSARENCMLHVDSTNLEGKIVLHLQQALMNSNQFLSTFCKIVLVALKMIDAKSESDVTSLYPPSTPASPKYHVYYVQSPSLDSHDDTDKASASASVQATPAYNSSSSMESPSHASTFGRQSNPRSSSASRVSGNWRWPRMIRKRSGKGWQEFSVNLEEGSVYDDWHVDEEDESRSPFLVAVVGFAVVFTAFCVIIWGASRPYRPQISIKVYLT